MEDIDVRKSEHDVREYRVIKLENGLQTLIVHDPGAVAEEAPKKESIQMERLAAVALSIGVGSFDSPTELQGLPHLLEHMFFGKEQKNSKTDGYLDFISEHGGSTNASTYAEYSSYHFEISGKYLKAALERFANCFIAPLIEKKALEAELNAVDSEFFEEIDDLDCILEFLRSSTLKESHLYKNIFHSGNKESLMGKEVDCADLQKEVLEFHSKNYHGKKMKLVVIGGAVHQWGKI